MTDKIFCFLDLETTGLDPKKDCILEVAWRFTDSAFADLLSPRTFVVDHGNDWGKVAALLRSAPQVVQDMHANSGLIKAVWNEKDMHTLDVIFEALEADLYEIRETNPDATIHLAGDSVWFDRNFLNANDFGHMLDEYLHHRLLDLSSIKVFGEAIGATPPSVKGTHRALDDVDASIATARLMTHVVYFDDEAVAGLE